MDDLKSDILLELHVPDFELAKEFYGGLGYEIVWEKADYLVMRSGNSILNFYGGDLKVYNHQYFRKNPASTPRGYGVEIIIPITHVADFYDKFRELYPKSIVADLEKRHSHEDFRAEDPYGFYLRFVERYNWVDGRDKNGVQIK